VVLPFLRPLRALRTLRGLGELRALRLPQASRLAAFLGTGFGHARAVIRRRGLHYVVGLVVAIMFVAAGLEVAFEAHAKGGTIHSYGGALWWAPDGSPARPAACPAVPGSAEALHLSRDRRFAGAPHEPG
jgi:hypothetical protein